MSPRLSTVPRAFAEGLRQQLLRTTPYRAWQLSQALASASPEVVAAHAAGLAADPREPMPGEGALLSLVVSRLSAD